MFDEMLKSLFQELVLINDPKVKAIKTKECESKFRSQFPRVVTRAFAVILCECLDEIWETNRVDYDAWIESNLPEIVIH